MSSKLCRESLLIASVLIGALVPVGDSQSTAHLGVPGSPQPVASRAPWRVATRSFQPGDGNPFSYNCDWRLIEEAPNVSNTLWSDSVLVGADPYTGLEHRMLLNLPWFVGSDAGQVPIGAQVHSATIQLLANDARSLPISVRAVMQSNLGEAGQLAGKDLTGGPSWNLRSFGLAWSAPGAGWPSSSSAAPLDTQSVEQSFSWRSFDITQAVRQWVADPGTNHGLLFAAAELSVAGQVFKGGGASLAQRPILNVTYSVPDDHTPPALAITSPSTCPVGTAYVEGSNGPDAVELTLSVGAQAPNPVVRLSPTHWSAQVPLSDTATAVEVLARDAAGNEAAAHQVIVWSATDISAGGATVIGRAEVLRLHASSASEPAVAWVRIDPGNGQADYLQAAGQVVAVHPQYAAPGTFEARATYLDAQQSPLYERSLQVLVIDAVAAAPITSQAGFLRELRYELSPTAEVMDFLAFTARDPARLVVTNAHTQDGSALVSIAHLGVESSPEIVQVRLGDAEGRVIRESAVYPFTFHHSEISVLGGDELRFTTQILPAGVLQVDPGMSFEVELFSDGSSFSPSLDPDGDRKIQIGTSDFSSDGLITLTAFHDWSVGVQFCRSIRAIGSFAAAQLGSSGSPTSGTSGQNSDPPSDLAMQLSPDAGAFAWALAGSGGGLETTAGCEKRYKGNVLYGSGPYSWIWTTCGHDSRSIDTLSGAVSIATVTWSVASTAAHDHWITAMVTDSTGKSVAETLVIKVHALNEINPITSPPPTIVLFKPAPWKKISMNVQWTEELQNPVQFEVSETTEYTTTLTVGVEADYQVVKQKIDWSVSVAHSMSVGVGPPGNCPTGGCIALWTRPSIRVETGSYEKWTCQGRVVYPYVAQRWDTWDVAVSNCTTGPP